MALTDFLPVGAHVALDTNSLIYHVEEHLEFASVVTPVFERIHAGTLTGHVSALSLMEVLVVPFRHAELRLANRYRELLYRSSNLILHEITPDIAEIAADIRARYRLTTPDAIVGATALEAGCTHFVTNDGRFRAVPNIEVLVIREHAEEKG